MEDISRELFAESYSSFRKPTGRPLGLLAELLVMGLTGLEDPICFSQLTNPILRSYGAIEEEYINLLKVGFSYSNKGFWPVLLRAITLPLDDSVFLVKQKNRRSKAASVIGNKVQKIFTSVKTQPMQHYEFQGKSPDLNF